MFLLNILLAIIWVVLTNQFTPTNFVAGFLLAYLLIGLTERVIGDGRYFVRIRHVISFGLFFVYELVLASVRVLGTVLSPRPEVKPGIVAIPLDVRSDVAIMLLANLITLTPGTLSLDTSADRRVLYVHTMQLDDPEAFRRQIKDGFERRLMEILS